nr:transposase (putative), gypsy type [Tanacetum cinerariifolium]
KFSESFLCLDGISRYYELDANVYPIFLDDDDEEIDLFVFINHADPTTVRTGETQIEEGHVLLLESTRHCVVLLAGVDDQGDANVQHNAMNKDNGDAMIADQIEGPDRVVHDEGDDLVRVEDEQLLLLRSDYGTSGAGASTGGKSVASLQSLLEGSTLALEVRVTTAVTVPFVTSSVTPTLEREEGGPTDSVIGSNLQTQHPTERSLVLDPSIMTTNIATMVITAASSIPVSRPGDEVVHASIIKDSTFAGTVGPDIAGPSQPAGMELFADSFILVDQLAPPVLFSLLRGIDYEQLFAEFNVEAARQTCLGAEVRMRLERELRGRKKFEGKYAMQANLLKERDRDVASLKAQLSLKEAEAAEAIRLCSQVATVEAAKAAQASELDGLKEQTTVLEGQVVTLESADIEAVQDMQVKVLSDRLAGLDSELMAVMKCLQSSDYHAALGGAIGRAIDKGIQDGLAAGIDHGKAGRGPVDVAAYNPSAEADYVSAVNALRVVDFPLLTQLESQKDASIVDIMGLLRLEGPASETPEAEQLQPSLKSSCFPFIIRRTKVLATATTTALSTTFIQASPVPLISVADYGVLDAELSTKVPSPSKIKFEKEELETTPEHTTTS